MPFLSSVKPLDGDRVEVTATGDPASEEGPPGTVTSEAWMRVVEAGRKLAWGAPGANDYHGELDVDPGDGPQEARLTVRLHTERAAAGDIEDGMAATLDGLRDAVESTPTPG